MKKIKLALLCFLAAVVTNAQDYAAFDVKGPVKRIEYHSPEFYDICPIGWHSDYSFTKKGFCKEFIGEKFHRDAKGRIVVVEDVGGNGFYFQFQCYYNSEGQLYWICAESEESGEQYPYAYTFFYDNHGDMWKIRGRLLRVGSKDYYTDYLVTIEERDAQGNWIKRRIIEKDSKRAYVESRKITYYE